MPAVRGSTFLSVGTFFVPLVDVAVHLVRVLSLVGRVVSCVSASRGRVVGDVSSVSRVWSVCMPCWSCRLMCGACPGGVGWWVGRAVWYVWAVLLVWLVCPGVCSVVVVGGLGVCIYRPVYMAGRVCRPDMWAHRKTHRPAWSVCSCLCRCVVGGVAVRYSLPVWSIHSRTAL